MAPPRARGITFQLGATALEFLTEWLVSFRNAAGMPYVVVTSLSEPASKASWPTSPGSGTSAAISAEMDARNHDRTQTMPPRRHTRTMSIHRKDAFVVRSGHVLDSRERFAAEKQKGQAKS